MQQQQQAGYDLLAVFPSESQAESATTKLQKEGFQEEEVFHIARNSGQSGEFRSHGPNQNRRDFFLQTQKQRANPAKVIIFGAVLAIVGGLLAFALSFAVPSIPLWTLVIIGLALGLVLGVLFGATNRGRARGNIGQKPVSEQLAVTSRSDEKNVVALRFQDPEDIGRTSRARAILLNHQGKIDRSVSRS